MFVNDFNPKKFPDTSNDLHTMLLAIISLEL